MRPAAVGDDGFVETVGEATTLWFKKGAVALKVNVYAKPAPRCPAGFGAGARQTGGPSPITGMLPAPAGPLLTHLRQSVLIGLQSGQFRSLS